MKIYNTASNKLDQDPGTTQPEANSAQFKPNFRTTLNDDSTVIYGPISEIQTVLERGAQELSIHMCLISVAQILSEI